VWRSNKTHNRISNQPADAHTSRAGFLLLDRKCETGKRISE